MPDRLRLNSYKPSMVMKRSVPKHQYSRRRRRIPDTSHAYTKWDCTYHIVSITKYRRKVLYGEVRKKPMLIIKQLCHYKGIEVAEGTMCVNHVHSSLRIPPKQSVAEVMGYLKGKSALQLFDENLNLRRRPSRDRTLWTRGNYVSTVGLNESVVRQYIKNQ